VAAKAERISGGETQRNWAVKSYCWQLLPSENKMSAAIESWRISRKAKTSLQREKRSAIMLAPSMLLWACLAYRRRKACQL